MKLSQVFSPPAHRTVVGAAALALAAALPALAAAQNEFSQAEKLVFTDHHLANVKAPGSLHYTFVKSGSQEAGFSDDVQIDVKRSAEKCCSVQGKFLSGEREVKLPEIAEAQPNPVILYFLEYDIREMARLTSRKSGNYFRNRIRKTLVDEAKVRDTTVTFQGRQVPAQEVTLTPYATDPARNRYERYADKRYTFVLASAVPGGVYQVRTALPGALPSDAPVMEETLTLAGPDAAPAGNKK